MVRIAVVDIASFMAPWVAQMREQIPGVELFDAHTHLGQNDPDGMSQTLEELLAVLHAADARGAFVFPMHEPDGYPPANDMVIEAAAHARRSAHAVLPREPQRRRRITEAERALDRGARGIKLHPRAEQFTLDHPDVRRLAAIAARARSCRCSCTPAGESRRSARTWCSSPRRSPAPG